LFSFVVTSMMMHLGKYFCSHLPMVLLTRDYLMFRVSFTRENDWSRTELLHKCLTRCLKHHSGSWILMIPSEDFALRHDNDLLKLKYDP
jgi:hypothetical protein